MSIKETEHYFLLGEGEMAKMFRAKDWDKTSLGNPKDWPYSLRTMVSVMLNNTAAMCITWGNDRIHLYNDAYSAIIGVVNHPRTFGIYTSEAFGEIWPLPLLKPTFEGAMKGKGVDFNDCMVESNRNGVWEECYFDFSYCPIRKEDGEVGGILVTVKDNTQKKIEEKKLIGREEKCRTMLEGADILIITTDETSKTNYSNKAYTDLTGWPIEKLLGYGWADLLHPDDKDGFLNLYHRSFRKKQSYTSDIRILNKDGKYTWLFTKGLPCFRQDGSFSGYIASCIDITERKNLEEERQKLIAIIEASSEFIGMVDMDYQIEYANPAAMEMLGIDSYANRKITEWIAPEFRSFANDIREELIKRDTFRHEICFLNEKTGIPFWIKLNAITIKNPTSKKIIGFATVSHNITKRKKAEETLRASEERFRLLAEALPQMIWETDNMGNQLYASGRWLEYTGVVPENQDTWKAIVHPDDWENNQNVWIECMIAGTVYKCDMRLKSKEGKYKWHSVIAEPIFNDKKKIIKWVGAFTNIHNEKRFMQELGKQVIQRTKDLEQLNESLIISEQRYHSMVEQVQDYALFYLNRKGTVENWNIGAQKIKGYHADEILGTHFSVFYTQQDQKDCLPEKLLQEALTTGKSIHEGWRVRKDKSLFWANITITAMHNAAKEVIGFSKVTHDLSEKKEASDKLKITAAALEQKNVELEKMNTELESFAYISSHDLQEPLRKIQTFASRILEKEYLNLSDSGKDNFKRMQNSAFRMQTLIEDLLAYSRINNSEGKFEKINLKIIVQEVIEDLKEELEQKNATIIIADMCECNIIPFQFRQLMHNIFSNSLKFASEEQPPIIKINSKIIVESKLDNKRFKDKTNYCHISISDNGIGFEPEYAEKIFELFQRLHGNTQYKGTGIGLAIVKKIVDNHNGIITATGELNKGATFDIYLPTIVRSKE